MNISVLIYAIVEARGCPPGHGNYLRKADMADIAEKVLPEVERLVAVNKQLLEACKKVQPPFYGMLLERHGCPDNWPNNTHGEFVYSNLKVAIAAVEGET